MNKAKTEEITRKTFTHSGSTFHLVSHNGIGFLSSVFDPKPPTRNKPTREITSTILRVVDFILGQCGSTKKDVLTVNARIVSFVIRGGDLAMTGGNSFEKTNRLPSFQEVYNSWVDKNNLPALSITLVPGLASMNERKVEIDVTFVDRSQ